MTMARNFSRSPAFTLTEILAATAILSVMFTIMFGILQQTSIGWQAANRKVEASQAARLALEQIARDLENCFTFTATNLRVPGTNTLRSYAFGFVSTNSYPVDRLQTGAQFTDGNSALFVVTPYSPSLVTGGGDLAEAGYVPIYISARTNISGIRRGRYALLRHFPTTNQAQTNVLGYQPITFFWRFSDRWETGSALRYGGTNPPNFNAIVDNCVRFSLRFIYTNNNEEIVTTPSWRWGRPETNGTWGPAAVHPADAPNSLPLAAEITMAVLDERTAERLYVVNSNRVLTPQQITNIALTNPTLLGFPDDRVRNVLLGGMTILQRVVSFKLQP